MSNEYQNTVPKCDEDRRKELADFLKTRRARVKPSQLNLASSCRRRAPGLRREEVAELAGVSSSWYTWLEQGRDIKPSGDLLSRIGKVLSLNPFEVNHMFTLAGRTPPPLNEGSHEKVPDTLETLLLDLIGAPAFILGERFDFILWNQKFTDLFFDLDEIPKEKRNWLEMIFEGYGPCNITTDWEGQARRSVAEFRWSVGKQVGSPWVKELVNNLRRKSPKFAEIWDLHDVQESRNHTFQIRHKELGVLSFKRSIYIPNEADYLRMVVLTPLSDLRKRND